jgi:hypothetical protein
MKPAPMIGEYDDRPENRRKESEANMSIFCGNPPTVCQLCDQPITTEFVDGQEIGSGSWLYMCPACHKRYGVGLGTGRGQHYCKLTVGEATIWKKVAG